MSDSNKDHAEGLGDQIKGKVEQAVGGLTGDRKTQAEGAVDEGKGSVQQGVGDLKDKVAGDNR